MKLHFAPQLWILATQYQFDVTAEYMRSPWLVCSEGDAALAAPNVEI